LSASLTETLSKWNRQNDEIHIKNDTACPAAACKLYAQGASTGEGGSELPVINYFIYLPNRPEQSPWECTATAIGHERVLPGSQYPPRRHPVDHHFTWEDGRVLHAYQILYITEGRGYFESGISHKRQQIDGGCIVILFPGIWHRYSPDPQTGWVENWIEYRGKSFDRARATGLLRPERSVLRVGLLPDLLQCFERCHALARRHSAGNQAMLSTMGLHILSILQGAPGLHRNLRRHIDERIEQAQLLIARRYHETIIVEQLARELHIGYSSFRQSFKAQTGLSPKQYQLQIRLQKAQEFLANTSKSVGEIAEILGFNTAYHLSNQFKKHVGLAPQIWRQKLERRQRR
jgi:AraC-like DNA-binding protein